MLSWRKLGIIGLNRTMTADMKEGYWSKWAKSYDSDGEFVVGKDIRQAIERRLLEERDLGKVIEFGCGTGFFTKVIAMNAKHVLATDLSDEMLDIAKSRFAQVQNVAIEKHDCGKTSFPTERFDSVFMANLIHVIHNPSQCLRESYRILREGGFVIIVDFTSHGMQLYDRIKLAIRYLRKWGVPTGHMRKNMSPRDLASLVESAGFRVVSVQLLSGRANALYLTGIKESVNDD